MYTSYLVYLPYRSIYNRVRLESRSGYSHISYRKNPTRYSNSFWCLGISYVSHFLRTVGMYCTKFYGPGDVRTSATCEYKCYAVLECKTEYVSRTLCTAQSSRTWLPGVLQFTIKIVLTIRCHEQLSLQILLINSLAVRTGQENGGSANVGALAYCWLPLLLRETEMGTPRRSRRRPPLLTSFPAGGFWQGKRRRSAFDSPPDSAAAVQQEHGHAEHCFISVGTIY